jgi:hypothetical protein
MVDIYPDEVISTKTIPKVKNGHIKPLLKWDLGELLAAAQSAQRLPHGLGVDDEWDKKRARVGDYTEVVRQLRNLLHPGRYTRDHQRKRVTKKHLQLSFEVCLAARDWLYDRIAKSLNAHFKEEDARTELGARP